MSSQRDQHRKFTHSIPLLFKEGLAVVAEPQNPRRVKQCGRVLDFLSLTLLLSACTSVPSQLFAKNPIEAHATTVPELPHFEYQNLCGKPCQLVVVRWQYDGSYDVLQGDAPAVNGRMTEIQVTKLSRLYRELRALTLSLPRDLTRSPVCQRFATDHAVKIFATPATVTGWRFRDNLGCEGFEKAAALRELEQQIEALLPAPTRSAQ